MADSDENAGTEFLKGLVASGATVESNRADTKVKIEATAEGLAIYLKRGPYTCVQPLGWELMDNRQYTPQALMDRALEYMERVISYENATKTKGVKPKRSKAKPPPKVAPTVTDKNARVQTSSEGRPAEMTPAPATTRGETPSRGNKVIKGTE